VVEAPKPVVVEMPKVQVKPEPKPEREPEPKPEMPVVTASSSSATAAGSPKPTSLCRRRSLPIEEVTKNWTVLSKSIFPRQVEVGKDIEVKSRDRCHRDRGGRHGLRPVPESARNLVMAPSPESPFRGSLSIDETNIKEIVIAAYEAYEGPRNRSGAPGV